MSLTSLVRFAVGPSVFEGCAEVRPIIDGTDLVDRAKSFETGRGWTPAGRYGGLIPGVFRFGPLLEHYTGRGPWERDDTAPVLGCGCGEWGCWPLICRAVLSDSTVTWTDFSQPHRTGWSYDGFGPFVFARDQFESAVADVVAQLGTA